MQQSKTSLLRVLAKLLKKQTLSGEDKVKALADLFHFLRKLK